MDRPIPPLGSYLLVALFFTCLWGLLSLSQALSIRNGVRTQGVIVGTYEENCGRGNNYGVVVRYTDRGGQVHTFRGCSSSIHGSPGDTVTLVYDPHDPSQFTPSDDLPFFLNGTLVTGFIALLLLPFWIRKRLRKPKHLEAWSLSGIKEPPLFHD